MPCSDSAYPKRPPFFSHKYVRLLTTHGVANELGPPAFVLLATVVHVEDARHYSGAPNFYNTQLVPMIGVGSVSALDRVRAKCVAAGWLRYIPGGRRSGPGRYWVTIPPGVDGGVVGAEGSSSDGTLLHTGDEQSGSKPGAKRRANREPPTLSPSLPPSSASAAARDGGGGELRKPDKPTPEERRALFTAVREVTGADPHLAGSHVGRVVGVLATANPPYSPDEVREFGRRFVELCPYARGERTRPEIGELGKYVARVRTNPAQPQHELMTADKLSKLFD